MSAMGQKRRSGSTLPSSAPLPEGDIHGPDHEVYYGPQPDSCTAANNIAVGMCCQLGWENKLGELK